MESDHIIYFSKYEVTSISISEICQSSLQDTFILNQAMTKLYDAKGSKEFGVVTYFTWLAAKEQEAKGVEEMQETQVTEEAEETQEMQERRAKEGRMRKESIDKGLPSTAFPMRFLRSTSNGTKTDQLGRPGKRVHTPDGRRLHVPDKKTTQKKDEKRATKRKATQGSEASKSATQLSEVPSPTTSDQEPKSKIMKMVHQKATADANPENTDLMAENKEEHFVRSNDAGRLNIPITSLSGNPPCGLARINISGSG